MWVNPLFESDALDGVGALIAANSLATIVAASPLRAAHLPLLLETGGDTAGPGHGTTAVLTGHVPRADPLAQAVLAGERLLCVFHGPRAYVSAGWYGGPGLPTYNFTVAHLSGRSELLGTDDLREHLVELIRTEESRKAPVDAGPWTIDATADARIDQLLPAVIGFRVVVDDARAKAKLGQNRTTEDRRSTIEHLAESPVAEHRAIATAMHASEAAPEPRKAGH
ncbi:FMN-binding negative transcriptional regulator [Curtobacterium sp. ZW137]|uniref:FMN-binding negative transcriptional regulator n=1 Tax=Curtobacterium sp. ZW137 TaxID=2485104 RepID=UPI000FC32D62|nr:FMN-binding negative transcriptional regulator [Curtobacterium sp. ZW137]ROP63764.1 PaiB family negative transcriptional regulator [Curtobacterium sp. ZW137]